jgi:hypothetical protein
MTAMRELELVESVETQAWPASGPGFEPPAPPRRLRSWAKIPLAVALLVLLLAELTVRVEASRLAPPLTWLTPEGQVKVGQMRALRAAGKTGGVVFLSSSVLDVGLDPGAFASDSGTKLRVYNGSLSGANMDELRWWADRIVVPLLRPRLIVVGLSSREFNANDPQAQKLAAQFFDSPSVRRVDGRETLGQRVERYAGDISYLFRYRKSLRRPSQVLHQNATIQLQKRYFSSPLGQEMVLSQQSFRHDLDAEFAATFANQFEVSPSKVAVFDGLLDDLRRTGATVVVVDAPVTQDYINVHPRKQADYNAYRQALRDSATHAGLRTVSFPVWNTTLFADPVHLNERGAQWLALRLSVVLRPELDAAAKSAAVSPGARS